MIEFTFALDGSLIPRNYHYCLYASLTSLIPQLKEAESWSIGRISNAIIFDDKTLRLNQSMIKIRCFKDFIPSLSPLIEESTLLLGKNSLVKIKLINGVEIKPKDSLSAWVNIKTDNNREPDLARFAVSLGKQLAKLEIDTLPTIGRKEQLIIKKQPCAVYPVLFSNLRESESMVLQTKGLGGRKHLGCGFFE